MKYDISIIPCFITVEDLELISRGMSVLAELAMKQGEYVAAQKFRECVALAGAKIERLKEPSIQATP